MIEPLDYQSFPQNKFHRTAHTAALVAGGSYFVVALATAVAMSVNAYLDRNVPGGFNFTSPWFYLTLIFSTSILAAIGWGFVWAGRAVALKYPRRVLLGKYLAMFNLTLVAVEAAGILTGSVMDPPTGADRLIMILIAGMLLVLAAVLILAVWAMGQSARALIRESEAHA